MSTTTPKNWGLLAQYESPREVYKACEKVRDAGYTKWDACTPFPVHGLDKAMGAPPSTLPWYVLIIGICGSVFALAFEIWSMQSDYPFILAGKPLLSIPAYVPVWYEFTVLSSCLTVFFGNWVLNRLPQYYHPAFKSAAFARVTDDKFFIMIEAKDARFDSEKTRALLKETGASHIEELED
jgi:hypothetical protein